MVRPDAEGARWRWTNRLLGTETAFTMGDPATLPLPPLDWVGRQVQEDLCLMDGNEPGTPLVAGHLCFASGWCLDDKMGQSFLAIHSPVPGFAENIGRPADLMMQRIKVGRPTARVNWTIHPSDRLNCAPALSGNTPSSTTGSRRKMRASATICAPSGRRSPATRARTPSSSRSARASRLSRMPHRSRGRAPPRDADPHHAARDAGLQESGAARGLLLAWLDARIPSAVGAGPRP